MPGFEMGGPALLVVGSWMLFWVGMLGLLWRRSLMGMLVGLLLGWVSVALAGIGFALLGGPPGAGAVDERSALGAAFVLCVSVLSGLQIAVGLGIVVARIKRRGSLDADDAALLEG